MSCATLTCAEITTNAADIAATLKAAQKRLNPKIFKPDFLQHKSPSAFVSTGWQATKAPNSASTLGNC